jgi:hypothetical protein
MSKMVADGHASDGENIEATNVKRERSRRQSKKCATKTKA